jgi:hypothetical protein
MKREIVKATINPTMEVINMAYTSLEPKIRIALLTRNKESKDSKDTIMTVLIENVARQNNNLVIHGIASDKINSYKAKIFYNIKSGTGSMEGTII